MIARGDSATMTHFSFHGGIAMASLLYSIREGSTEFDVAGGGIRSTRFQKMIEEIASGEAWGCMDITEPDAGSDMARLRTRGEQDADGNWFVTGQKIFITSGHGKYHLVVARTEDASNPDDPMAGLQGLSMFIVQAYDDLPDGTRKRHVVLERIEEKMGHHGSVTAAISFDRVPAQLVGKRGEGFKYMLTLMNNARIGVGFECIGLAEAAYRMASTYAAERRSMGKPIARHEMLADYLDEMRVDIRALRALGVEAAYHEELANKLSMLDLFRDAATPAERDRITHDLPRLQARARRLTPLLKYLAAEKCVEIARRNIQIHGGVGFIKEYGAEKLLRDAIVLPIYEGTSQIQALMAMKDTLLGILKRPQDFARRLGQARWRSLSSRDELDRGVARLQSLSLGAQQFLLTRTAAGKLRSLAEVPVHRWTEALTKNWDPKRDFALAMLHAERLIRLLADEARARMLHEEITTTGQRILADLAAPASPESKAAE
jgi:alkylation response protein AidB-like acyl-CoA dehydrogenase